MSQLKVNKITDLNEAEIFEPNLMTAQAASGTAVDFFGIPSWAKRVTVMFSGVSLTGSSSISVQLGSGTVQTTGYESFSTRLGISGVEGSSLTTGFMVNVNVASRLLSGAYVFNLCEANTWVGHGTQATDGHTTASAGQVALSDALDRIRITTVNGTDVFDAGTINVMYE